MIGRRPAGAVPAALLAGWLALAGGIASAGDDAAAPPIPIGGPFELIDQSGSTVTDRDLRGRYLLIYFGYASCPDVCPLELDRMGRALDALEEGGTDSSRVQPLFVSIDPKRDTPAALRDFVRPFHARLIALTGDRRAVARVARAYRIQARIFGDPEGGSYLIRHSSNLYLIGPDGAFLRLFLPHESPDRIAAVLRRHLAGG